MDEQLLLESEELAVAITPGKGADIRSIRHVRSGTELCFVTPWHAAASPAAHVGADSKTAWLQRYAGGWQVLCPNAGDERSAYGTTWGYHGEAALVPWRVEDVTLERCSVSVELFSAPFRLERTLELVGARLRIHEGVVNLSPDDLAYSYVHHPAFGPPLIGPECELMCGAQTIISDAEAPGTHLAADTVSAWPWADAASGPPVDLRKLAQEGEARSVFACLTDFASPFFAFSNAKLGLGVAMRWDAAMFPHAWCWQELYASSGFPWYRRAYVAAVEPANQLPGSGSIGAMQRGAVAVLPGGGKVESDLILTVFSPTGSVTGVDPDGTVHFDGAREVVDSPRWS